MYNRGSEWWLDPEFEKSQPTCRECEEHYQRIDNAREFFDEITEILYGTKSIDIAKLEFCLDELGHYIGAEIKPRAFMPNVTRKIYIQTYQEMEDERAIAS